MAIKMRTGLESEFDPSKMIPGEWAVSTDSKYVRMCFAPGIVVRMATYENFEEDVEKIQSILTECREIESAVKSIQSIVASKAALTVEYANNAEVSAKNAKASEDKAKMYANNAQAVANVSIASKEKAGLVRGGDNLIGEDGELIITRTTTNRTLENSNAGGLRIESVDAGESEQRTTTGAQLFDITTFTPNIIVGDDGGVSQNGSWGTSDYIKVSEGTYTLSQRDVNFFQMRAVAYDAEKNFLEYFSQGIQTRSYTYDFPKGTAYCRFSYSITIDTTTAVRENMMFNIGSEPLPWEPYTGAAPSPSPSYPQEIESSVVSEIKVVGKNLLKNNATTQTINGVTFTINEDGSITANGTSSSAFQFNIGSTILSPGTYIVNGCPSDGGTETYTIRIGKGEESAYVGIETGSGYTLTLTEETLISVNIGMGAGAKTSNTTFYPMISIDGGDYEPYTETTIHLSTPITLHGIGEAKDRIVKQDGVWGVERNVYSVIFKGTENPQVFSPSIGGLLLGYYNISAKLNSGSSIITGSFSNYLKEVTPDALWSNIITGFAISDTGYPIRIRFDEKISTVDEAKEWLAAKYSVGEPLTIMVPIATPTFESLPSADQIALHSLVTYDTVTYISTDSEIEPLIEVEYGTSKVGGHSLEALNTAKRNEININLLNQLTTDLAIRMAESEE